MNGKKEHQFRPRKLPKSAIEDTTRRSAERERARYEDWSSFRKHKRVIADAIAAQVIGQVAINPTIKASLAALEKKAQGRVAFFRDVTFERPHTFDLHPGLNVLGPPYDFTLRVKEGSQKPSVQTSTADGTFGVVATAMAGPNSYSTNDTAGAAGVGLVIVPSDPNRTLTIRPYFQWSYDYACESHGSPTAHCHGAVSAAITGHRGSERFEFPLKDRMLFAAGSDLWDDAHALRRVSQSRRGTHRVGFQLLHAALLLPRRGRLGQSSNRLVVRGLHKTALPRAVHCCARVLRAGRQSVADSIGGCNPLTTQWRPGGLSGKSSRVGGFRSGCPEGL